MLAIVRPVSGALERCELTHYARQSIDVSRARKQHSEYVEALESLGIRVLEAPEQPDLADSVFVEDTAIVVDQCAVLMRPGALSRRPEVASIEPLVKQHRKNIFVISEPGTMDGGDVLVCQNAPTGGAQYVLVGISSRTNKEGIEQLRGFLKPFGIKVVEMEVKDCLHLKSAATQITPGRFLINPDLLSIAVLAEALDQPSVDCVVVDPSEPSAANIVGLSALGAAIFPSEFPKTLALIRERHPDLKILTVPASELAKAEGAVTCCSIVFREADDGASLSEL